MRSAALWMVGASLVACGHDPDDGEEVDCSKVTGTDTFVVGLEKVGEKGMLDFKMQSTTPAPPARGKNTWTFQILSMQSGVVGAPVDGATLEVIPFMPAHGHDAGEPVGISPMSDPGTYKLDPVNLWMPGVWETTIRATSGATTDSAIYKFCVM